MSNYQSWENFLTSGNIDDYLNYSAKMRQNQMIKSIMLENNFEYMKNKKENI